MSDAVQDSPVLASVAMICPVLNEAKTIEEFIRSVAAMDALPAELIIVDGGSTDGTVEKILALTAPWNARVAVKVIVDSTCRRSVIEGAIARARNVAFQAVAGDIVACTDAGCRLHREWLRRIVTPLLDDSSLCAVGGWYVPDARSFLERRIAEAWFRPPEEIGKTPFTPSSRSFAVRKSAWAQVGGYPEGSYTGEGTLFVERLRQAGCAIAAAPEALVSWRVRSSLRAFAAMSASYGYGDGVNRILARNAILNTVKILAALLPFAAGVLADVRFFLAAAVIWWMLPFLRRPAAAFRPSTIFMFPLLGFVKILADGSYLAGYIRGRVRAQRRPPGAGERVTAAGTRDGRRS